MLQQLRSYGNTIEFTRSADDQSYDSIESPNPEDIRLYLDPQVGRMHAKTARDGDRDSALKNISPNLRYKLNGNVIGNYIVMAVTMPLMYTY